MSLQWITTKKDLHCSHSPLPIIVVANSAHSDLDEIRPEEFSSSYRRLVLQDFTDKDGAAEYSVRNCDDRQKKDDEVLVDLVTRINLARDSMDEDEDVVMPLNFPAVGCILLEFVLAFTEHMVRIQSRET